MRNIREYFTGVRILGLFVFMLAVVSVIYGVYYNQTQSDIVRCGTIVLNDTVSAIKVRDAAALALSNSNSHAVKTRYVLLLILADAPEAPTKVTKDQALRDYENTIWEYDASIDAYAQALQQAPLPSGSCLQQ